MFIDKDSIIIDNVKFGQYIISAEYQYNKLWAEDSGRNLAGEQSGTLLGIFPKIILNFRKLTKEEMEVVVPILDKAVQSTTYYDPYKKQLTTMDTYTGDYNYVNKGEIGNGKKNETFSVSVIAVRARS